MTTKSPRPLRRRAAKRPERKSVINRLLESKLIGRLSYEEYRTKVRGVYAGPRGAFLATCSMLSLHAPLGERLFRERKFDLRGSRRILDVGSGAGQIARHLLKYADPTAQITCRQRMRSRRPIYLAADLAELPFADQSFDCVTCGYVLEHLPDPRLGLAELSRVMQPGGRMLPRKKTSAAPGPATSGTAAPTTAQSCSAFAAIWVSTRGKSSGSRACTSSSAPAASASSWKSAPSARHFV
jgi:SAM-dependent methyltransferase